MAENHAIPKKSRSRFCFFEGLASRNLLTFRRFRLA